MCYSFSFISAPDGGGGFSPPARLLVEKVFALTEDYNFFIFQFPIPAFGQVGQVVAVFASVVAYFVCVPFFDVSELEIVLVFFSSEVFSDLFYCKFFHGVLLLFRLFFLIYFMYLLYHALRGFVNGFFESFSSFFQKEKPLRMQGLAVIYSHYTGLSSPR